MADSLDKLLSIARATWAGMSADEREAMLKAQRESWVRGEIAMGSDKDEAKERRAIRTRSESDAIASVALDTGDTRVEPDFKAAVRDLAAALISALAALRSHNRKLGGVEYCSECGFGSYKDMNCDGISIIPHASHCIHTAIAGKHAAAIAAARGET